MVNPMFFVALIGFQTDELLRILQLALIKVLDKWGIKIKKSTNDNFTC
jgi:hypothetical protein